jgi:hypothetical protein
MDFPSGAAPILRSVPFRVRFQLPLSIAPPIAGAIVALVLWGQRAEPAFFMTAVEVMALGAVGMALQGRFFRVSRHVGQGPSGVYAMLNTITTLVGVGLGMGFAFEALAEGASRDQHLALTAGGLVTGVTAFALQAVFGTPGLRDDD